MRLSSRLLIVLFSIFSLLVTFTALVDIEMACAFSSGPLDGKTGAPGEGNCTDCHSTFPLDSGEGYISTIFGDIIEYTPGETYGIFLEVGDPEASRWGFELTFIDEAGEQAGTLVSEDANTQLSTSEIAGNIRQYAKHTTAGTQAGTTGFATWDVSWIAPESGTGAVTLYAMGNAANNNGFNSGDRIYSFVFQLGEDATNTGAEEAPLFASLRPNYPNPFNPSTRIDYSLQQDADVRLSIYDSQGRLVTVLRAGTQSAGDHSAEWNGRDARGDLSASGLYFARLQDKTGRDLAAARKMMMVK